MQNIFIGTIIFSGVILQTSFLPNFFSTGSVPDIALIMIIIWTVKTDFNSIWVRAIFAGLMLDLVSFYPIGINIFSFITVSFMTNSLCKRFLVLQAGRRFFIFSIIIVIGTMLNHLIVATLSDLQNFSWERVTLFNGALIYKPLYNLVIFATLYWPLGKIDKIFVYKNKITIKK
ncbi:MAG: Rod shape-determining protein MreD [Candidatus Moranbacteria bacterium GW2011_GWA2_39_41]|nr:MAG: Rod shape-determining protein MreD [Candidatus Moranbacteria bacterium GW2011_GWA2_39_41]